MSFSYASPSQGLINPGPTLEYYPHQRSESSLVPRGAELSLTPPRTASLNGSKSGCLLGGKRGNLEFTREESPAFMKQRFMTGLGYRRWQASQLPTTTWKGRLIRSRVQFMIVVYNVSP